jgi:hypothetical protein
MAAIRILVARYSWSEFAPPKDFGGPGEVDAETPWHHLLIITTVHAACDEVANAIRILVARYSWSESAPPKDFGCLGEVDAETPWHHLPPR